jgi:glucose uptake protein GlcU
MKPSKKQKQVTAELLSGVIHQLGELGVDYSLVIEGCDTIFTNSSIGHAVSIMRDTVQLQDKIYEMTVERKAEKIVDYPDE